MAPAFAAHAPELSDTSLVYRFQGYRLDTARWQLSDPGGEPVALAPAPLRVLLLLVEQRERVVSKDELLEVLRHGMVISEAALTRAIGELRRALGGGENATRWVQSVRGRGYRFAAPLDDSGCDSEPEQDARHRRRHSGIHPAVPRPVAATIDRRLRLAQLRWGLTPRQLEVLRGLVNGLSNGDLAQTLPCSLRTVEAHMTALLDRCDASSRLSLVATFWIDL